MAMMPTNTTVWAGCMRTRGSSCHPGMPDSSAGDTPWAEHTLIWAQTQMASCQAIMEKRHTSVRTDDDSGFDTLWLLKKMDSRSEKTDREQIRPGDSNTDTRGQHHPRHTLGGF